MVVGPGGGSYELHIYPRGRSHGDVPNTGGHTGLGCAWLGRLATKRVSGSLFSQVAVRMASTSASRGTSS